MKYWKISDTKAGKNKKIVFLIEDEDFVLSIKDWAKKIGESKYFGQYVPISRINPSLGVISYIFAQFVGKYLHIYWPNLANDEIKI